MKFLAGRVGSHAVLPDGSVVPPRDLRHCVRRRQERQQHRDSIKTALKTWTGGKKSAERKLKLFEDRLVDLALERLTTFN